MKHVGGSWGDPYLMDEEEEEADEEEGAGADWSSESDQPGVILEGMFRKAASSSFKRCKYDLKAAGDQPTVSMQKAIMEPQLIISMAAQRRKQWAE